MMKDGEVGWKAEHLNLGFVRGGNLEISDLTPSIAQVLFDTHCEGANQPCSHCHASLHSLIQHTLAPISALSEMYSSLPRNWSTGRQEKQTRGHQARSTCGGRPDREGRCSSLVEEERDIFPAAPSFIQRFKASQRTVMHDGKSKSRKLRSQRKKESEATEEPVFATNFSELIMRTPPAAPPTLFKHTTRKSECHGKVRLVLRIASKSDGPESCLTADAKKKQVLLRDPYPTLLFKDRPDGPKKFEKAPRLFSFDLVYEQKSTALEICSGTLVELLHNVVNGNDACLLMYGYPMLGKTALMVGDDDRTENIGIIPCAISWLYQLVEDRQQRTGARFAIRISAVEVVGKSENLKDLLGEQGNGSVCSNVTSPSIYLPRERNASIQLSDFTELRAATAEKAAFYFDAALSARTSYVNRCGGKSTQSSHPAQGPSLDAEESRSSSMIFTLHVYQYLIDKVGTGEVHGGRSRFHLVDLSGLTRKRHCRDAPQGPWMSLSALGNVIVSLANGSKHVPHRDSKLTTLLRESMGPVSSRVTFIASVSADSRHSFETLSTLQVTSRIHRSRKRKGRYSSTSSSGGDSSADERLKHRRRCKPVTPMLRTEACQSDAACETELTSPSAAEESCDTVIYLGPKGEDISDRELTDFEHPPSVSESTLVTATFRKTAMGSGKPTHQENVTLSLRPLGERTGCGTFNRPPLPSKNEDGFSASQCRQSLQISKVACLSDANPALPYQNGKAGIVPVKHTDSSEAPIVVNITNLPMNRSLLEMKADKVLNSPLKVKLVKLPAVTEKNIQISESSEGSRSIQNSTAARTMVVSKDSESYSLSLPIRARNRTYSIDPVDACDGKQYGSLRCTRQPSLKTFCKEQDSQRQCVSGNSSPVKQNRGCFPEDPSDLVRSSSLDGDFNRKGFYGGSSDDSYVDASTGKCSESQESLSSKDTVANFERQLVSKIAERFALEDEMDFVDFDDNVGFNSQEFFIDDDLESIGAGILSDGINVEDYDHRSASIHSSRTLVAGIEDLVLDCNICIGDCKCGGDYDDSTVGLSTAFFDKRLFAVKAVEPDSAEDTDERTDNVLRRMITRHNSCSSCDSHPCLRNNTRKLTVRPPSGGVSSGYESMQCDGSANASFERVNQKSPVKTDYSKGDAFERTIYEQDGEDLQVEERKGLARPKSYLEMKKLLDERLDLKAQLNSTLSKLAVSKLTLSDVDQRLRNIRLENSEVVEVLSRENRILEQKIEVCKSHLNIVTYIDVTPSDMSTSRSVASPGRKSGRSLAAGLFRKLSRSLSDAQNYKKKLYRVTAV